MDIKFGFTSASKNVGNKDENGKRVQSKISNVVANIKAIVKKNLSINQVMVVLILIVLLLVLLLLKRLHMSLILNVLHVVNLFILSQVE